MTKRTAACLLCAALWVGCGDDEPETPMPTETAPTPPAPTPEPTPPAEEQAAPTPAGGGAALPRAEDVLPSGEVSPGSLVVTGNGYRFQVPQGFASVDADPLGADVAYAGQVNGIISPTRLTMYVTQEEFSGTTAEFAEVKKAQASMLVGEVRDIPGGFMKVAGESGSGVRFRASGEPGTTMYQVYMHEGRGYTFHCVIPPQANAWPNVGSDCMIRASTFHVAPPAAQ